MGEIMCYRTCQECRSHYLQPMPSDRLIGLMYGPDYESAFSPDPMIADPRDRDRVGRWLSAEGIGHFLDYGCGQGSLLIEAVRLGWTASGLEFNREVARSVSERTGVPVMSAASELPHSAFADVIHLGDVLEHLPRLEQQFPAILELLKPGGILLAQGPLEGNQNLFTMGVRAVRSIRRSQTTEQPPYHVILATADGQRRFFERFSLEELDFHITEIAWPAPSGLSFADVLALRRISLYLLRRASQALGVVVPRLGGNRFFYAGRWTAQPKENA